MKSPLEVCILPSLTTYARFKKILIEDLHDVAAWTNSLFRFDQLLHFDLEIIGDIQHQANF